MHENRQRIYTPFTAVIFMMAFSLNLYSQDVTGRGGGKIRPDSNATEVSIQDSSIVVTADTVSKTTPQKRIKGDFSNHSPKKATWMSAALPGLGQIYNRRYWKPPIIYAGLGVALYFLIDNQVKFTEARNSYRARMNVAGYTISTKYSTMSSEQILADRDFYRTNRDYSIIGVGGVYLLNIIDAVVDAHLRRFDISDDLSMKVRPSFQYSTVASNGGLAPMPGMALTLKF